MQYREVEKACAASGFPEADPGRDADCPDHAPKILVIDDTPEEIRSVIIALRHHHLHPSVVTDGWQGYQRALALVPDLILLDVRMPGMDGFAVCRLLKESPVTRNIPVIYLSSAGGTRERMEGLTHGAVDYVVKPFLPEEVLARIRIHLQLEPRVMPEVATAASALTHDEVLLNAAIRFIREHLDALPALDDIAHRVGVYDKKLSAIFRQQLGTSVFAWVREERLRRGCQLLTDTRLSIQDVAEQVGFQSACNFITAFRERMGVTPTQFRKRGQADPPFRSVVLSVEP